MEICLVSGATGFIGSNLVKLLCNNYNVYGTSKTDSSFTHERYKHIKFDITDPKSYDLLPKKVDFVFHLAQSEDFRDFPNSSKKIFDVNTLSTIMLLEYSRKSSVKSFILTSSGGIYGHGNNPFSEDDLPVQKNNELGFYLGTKMCSEILAENYTSFFNMIILRPFFVYGPGQNKNMLIPRLIESVKNNKEIKLQGENGIKINPLYVSDAVLNIEKALFIKGSRKINIAGYEVINLREIGNIIGELISKKPIFDIDYTSEPKNIIANINLMESLLIKPKIDIKSGIFEICKDLYI